MRLEGKQVTIQLPDGNGGLVEKTYEMKIPRREKDKVYIVGCAGNKESVPFGDPDAEYWGVNNLYGVPLPGAKWDRWFEIHNIWYEPSLGKLVRRDDKDFRGQTVDDYMKGLASIGCPVYMQQFWPELIPLSTPYPIGEVLKFFAEPNERKSWTLDLQTCRYLTNSITYQIVLAIVEGFKRIEVWAVDMAVGTEYQAQRPSCEFWLGVAAGMGIEVYIPPENDLLKTRFMYGLEEKKQDAFKKKVKKLRVDLSSKMGQAQKQLSEAQKAVDHYVGAIHSLGEIDKIWSNFDDKLVISS